MLTVFWIGKSNIALVAALGFDTEPLGVFACAGGHQTMNRSQFTNQYSDSNRAFEEGRAR
jgi:hypothetical protein